MRKSIDSKILDIALDFLTELGATEFVNQSEKLRKKKTPNQRIKIKAETRQCKRCKLVFPLTTEFFYFHKRDGLFYWDCKPCYIVKQEHRKQRQKIKEEVERENRKKWMEKQQLEQKKQQIVKIHKQRLAEKESQSRKAIPQPPMKKVIPPPPSSKRIKDV